MHGLERLLGGVTARLLRRLRAVLARRAVEREMDEEMRFHIEMEAAELERAGLDAAEARRQARVSFGGVERFKDEARDGRAGVRAELLWRDLRLAARALCTSGGFTGVVLLTLAVSTGAALAAFALLERIALRPLPYPDSERLMHVTHDAAGLGQMNVGLSSGNVLHYREHATAIALLATYYETVLNLASGEGSAERVSVVMAEPELFDVLGVQPALGRAYAMSDAPGGIVDLNGTLPVVIGYELWQRRFGKDSSVIGRLIHINDRPREIVGVLPPDVALPTPSAQVWMLYVPEYARASVWGGPGYGAVGRLRAGITPAVAEAELKRLLPSIVGRTRDATPDRLAQLRLVPRVTPLRSYVVGDSLPLLRALCAGVLILLLVATLDVANLVLVRAGQQARQVAVRRALGARTADVVRPFLLEGLLLSIAGTALGLALASGALRLLVWRAPVQLPRLQEVRLDGWAVLAAAALALLQALVFGLAAVLDVRKERAPGAWLRLGGSVGLAAPARRARDALVATQVALAVMLVAASGLMLRTALSLARVEPGFAAEGLLTVEIGLPYTKADRYRQVYAGVLDRLRALPGVTGAATTSEVPLTGAWGDVHRVVEAPEAGSARDARAALVFCTPGYFTVMGTRVLEGSATLDAATTTSHPVLVSAALARRLFPESASVGRQIVRTGADGARNPAQPSYTIVGVVEDVRRHSLAEPPAEAVYVPLVDPPVEPWIVPTEMTIVLRTTLRPPDALAADVRRALAAHDASLSVARVRPMTTIVSASLARTTFLTLLLAIAGATALFLAAVGIWGVVAAAVRQRRAEMGLRLALGASRAHVTALVVRETSVIVTVGTLAGVPLSLAGTRVLRAVLFGVDPADPPTLLGAICVLLLAALLACYIPARRAARLDPVATLRLG